MVSILQSKMNLVGIFMNFGVFIEIFEDFGIRRRQTLHDHPGKLMPSDLLRHPPSSLIPARVSPGFFHRQVGLKRVHDWSTAYGLWMFMINKSIAYLYYNRLQISTNMIYLYTINIHIMFLVAMVYFFTVTSLGHALIRSISMRTPLTSGFPFVWRQIIDTSGAEKLLSTCVFLCFSCRGI